MRLDEAMVRRPAVGAALAFAAGTMIGLHWHLQWQPAVGLTAGLLLARLVRGRRRRIRQLTWLGCAVMLAWVLAAGVASRRHDALTALLGPSGKARLELAGTVGADWEVRELSRGGGRYSFSLSNLTQLPVAPGVPDDPRRLRDLTVRVVWYGPAPDAVDGVPVPAAGERWVFRGKAARVGRQPARQRVELTSRLAESQRLAHAGYGNWRALAAGLRRECARRLALGSAHSPEMQSLVQAMLLGYRNEIPPALNRIFRNSGTIHVFAISGMHVVIVAGFMTALIGPLGMPRTRWVLVLGPALLAYTVVTGAQPSALRACLMSTLYLAGPLVGRRPDGFSTLAVSAIALLVWDPTQLADVGFVLSYTVVAGLLTLTTAFARRLHRLPLTVRLTGDARATRELGGEIAASGTAVIRQAARWLWRALVDLLAVSVAAWLASAPLTALYFGRLTPAALLANLVVVPLSFVMVAGGCLSLLAGSVAGVLSSAVNQVLLASAWVMTGAARASVALPGMICRVPAPPLWLVGVWYLLLAVWGWYLSAADRQRPVPAWIDEGPLR